MRYEILNNFGDVINTIEATEEYMLQHYTSNQYREAPIVDIPTIVPITPPVYSKYIDIGPFFDRFKELKILVLTHPDPTIKALITDIQIRKWIDLDLQEVQQALQYIGTVIPQLTSDRILEIINTPVADHENLALRKLYFNA